jgi:hypothetical protein
MPTYEITAPDGSVYEIDAPEGASEADAVSFLQSTLTKQPKAKPITEGEYDEAWLANVAGLGFEVGDEAVAGVRSLFGSDYSKELAKVRQSQQKLGEYDAFGNILGKVAGGVPAAIATGGPAAQLAARALPAAGRLGQAAAVGAGYGGAAGFGSGEGDALNRLASAGVGATLGAGFGATVEGVVSPVVGRLVQYFGRQPAMFDPNTGSLSPQGQKLVAEYAQRSGLNVDDLSNDLQRELAKQAASAGKARAVNPQQAMAMAEAETLPVRGPMTQGQLSQDPELQLFESEAFKGRFGEQARTSIDTTYRQIQEALEANAEAIRARVGGVPAGRVAASEPAQRGQAIQDALATMKGTAREESRALYTKARQGGDAAIDPNAYRQGVQNMVGDVVENFDLASIPKVAPILDKLVKSAETDGSASALVSNVFRARRQFTSLQGELGADGAAAGAAKRALDKHLIDTMDQAAISGDDAAVGRWREAIKSYREYATKFEGDDLIQKLTDRGNFGTELKVAPEDAVNVIFGRDGIGFVSKGGMTRDLMKMREALGDDSVAWKALKEEAFLRFMRKADGAVRPTERGFSGAGLSKAWEDANEKSPHLLRVMFTNEERNLISQFVRYAQRVTVSHSGGVNTSNTGGAVALMMKKLLGSQIVGPKVIAFLEGTPLLKGFTQMPDAIRAAGSAQGRVQTMDIPALANISPAVTPLGSQSAGRNNRRQ